MNDYTRGRRDGKEMTYKPPVPARIFTRSTKEERERLDNYDQGYRHGKKERERRKK